MTGTMVPQAPGFVPVRRLIEAIRPAAGGAAEDHLHYDRAARVWRTHAELARPAPVAFAAAGAGAQLQECA